SPWPPVLRTASSSSAPAASCSTQRPPRSTVLSKKCTSNSPKPPPRTVSNGWVKPSERNRARSRRSQMAWTRDETQSEDIQLQGKQYLLNRHRAGVYARYCALGHPHRRHERHRGAADELRSAPRHSNVSRQPLAARSK